MIGSNDNTTKTPKITQEDVRYEQKIRALFEQSFIRDDYVNVGPDGVELGFKFDPGKFAELIVQDSADFIANMGEWCGGHGEPRCPSPSECAQKLKQRYGVE